MSTSGSTFLTSADYQKRVDANGNLAPIVELLTRESPVFGLHPVIEGNMDHGHKAVVRTGLPQGTWVRYGIGAAKGKTDVAEIRYGCGMLEFNVEADARDSELSGKREALMTDQVMGAMQGMAMQLESHLFYGDERVIRESFTGYGAHYNTLATGVDVEQNIKSGGGTANLSSIWLLTPGEMSSTLFYPKGASGAGFQREDMGKVVVKDANGNNYVTYQEFIRVSVGLAVTDWRQHGRICNIPTGNGDTTEIFASSPTYDLPKNIRDLIDRLDRPKGNRFLVMNRRVKRALRRQLDARLSAGGGMTTETLGGVPVDVWEGIPIYVTDALTVTETQVT